MESLTESMRKFSKFEFLPNRIRFNKSHVKRFWEHKNSISAKNEKISHACVPSTEKDRLLNFLVVLSILILYGCALPECKKPIGLHYCSLT